MREIEDDAVVIEALHEYLASLPKEEFDEIAALVSAKAGVPRRVVVETCSIPFADAMSLVEQWPDAVWSAAGNKGG